MYDSKLCLHIQIQIVHITFQFVPKKTNLWENETINVHIKTNGNKKILSKLRCKICSHRCCANNKNRKQHLHLSANYLFF